jgi:hypothetical protein
VVIGDAREICSSLVLAGDPVAIAPIVRRFKIEVAVNVCSGEGEKGSVGVPTKFFRT